MIRVRVQLRGDLLPFLFLLLALPAAAQRPPSKVPAETVPEAPRGPELVRVKSYPQLHLDGKPFVIHAATFFYYRLPHDLWEASLEQHRLFGINTIDLPIPWNWHEPREGDFDFDGRTNPRRDLRGLLRLISEKGFRLIVRPGPLVDADWRNAGCPEWLARCTEVAPLLDKTRAGEAETAVHVWLADSAHLEKVRLWLTTLARELAPYSPRQTLTVRMRNEKGDWESTTVPGPLLFVQVGDSLLGSAGGPAWERYLDELRTALEAGGLQEKLVVHAGRTGGPPMVTSATGAIGDWFPAQPAEGGGRPGEQHLTARHVAELQFAVERLKGQPELPAMVLGFQAGWPARADDSRPVESHPANTLLASRLLVAQGAQALGYSPAQDSLTPAGFETPAANRHYRWDAPLDLAGRQNPRSRAVGRNADVLRMWNRELATSHLRTDFGVALPIRTAQGAAHDRLATLAKKLSRIALLAGLASELLDPEMEPVENLLRHAVVLLPAWPSDSGELSERAQRTLVEYVRRGGVLAVWQPRPSGNILDELWAATPAQTHADTLHTWTLGAGRVIDAGADTCSWVELDEDFLQTRMRGEAHAAIHRLEEVLRRAGVRPAVRRAAEGPQQDDLLISQRVSDAESEPLGVRQGGFGLLSATNLNYDETLSETIQVLSPHAPARGTAGDYVQLDVQLPPRESLLLPMHYALCSTAKQRSACRDAIIAATAELLDVQRDGKTLELTFYTPTRATLLLRLAAGPRKVDLEDYRPEAVWNSERRELKVILPRGAWPSFTRTLRIHLPYEPAVPEPPKEKPRGRRDFDASIADAVRLPLGDDASLPTEPPLVALEEHQPKQLLVQGVNYDELGRDVDFKIEGAVRGSDSVGLGPGETRQTSVTIRMNPEQVPFTNSNVRVPEGLLGAELEARSGRDRRRSPVFFVVVPKEGVARYRLDFDRDGADEWTLENQKLRVIVSPELGGRILGLTDKESRTSLLSSVGGGIDLLGDAGPAEALRDFTATWQGEKKDAALRLRYESPHATIEKVLRLTEEGELQMDYAWRTPAQPLAVVQSVPAQAGRAETQFCWKEKEEEEKPHCASFVPGGEPLVLAPAVQRLEVRAAGRPTFILAWDAGTMRIVMKNFSAMLRLALPVASGAEPQRVQLKLRAMPLE